MKLNEIITYCRLKDIIKKTEILSQSEMYSGGEHTLVKLRIAKSSSTHVDIIYRSTGGTHAALVYAEIVYTGLFGEKDEILTANAKLCDIKNELFGYDYEH